MSATAPTAATAAAADRSPRNDEEKQNIYVSNKKKPIHPSLSNQIDPLSEEEALISLLTKEIENDQHFPNTSVIENDPFLAGARRESVVWILKAKEHHSFSAATAAVAVNFFDELINTKMFEKNRPWVPQLAAVACLTLAVKMEEDNFPGLTHFQVDESYLIFDAKTVKRMELLVLSKLQWKMNPVTPISFLCCIVKRLETSSNYLANKYLERCVCLLFSFITDWRFMGYPPSIVAASIAKLVNPNGRKISIVTDDHEPHIFSILQIQNDKLEECCKMIEEASRNDGLEEQVPLEGIESKEGEV